jgi:hypothetical protein
VTNELESVKKKRYMLILRLCYRFFLKRLRKTKNNLSDESHLGTGFNLGLLNTIQEFYAYNSKKNALTINQHIVYYLGVYAVLHILS